MRISQKQIYKISSDIPEENNSNFQIMEKIREFLDVKTVNEIKRTKKDFIELSYEVRTTKKSSCDLLIDYLSTRQFCGCNSCVFQLYYFCRIRLSGSLVLFMQTRLF